MERMTKRFTSGSGSGAMLEGGGKGLIHSDLLFTFVVFVSKY